MSRSPHTDDAKQAADPDRMLVLGVPVSIVNLNSAARIISSWAKAGASKVVFVRDVASLVLASESPPLLALHHSANLIVPDGAPLAVVGRQRGHGEKIGQVPGADLMETLCCSPSGLRHYFYGGKSGIPDRVARHFEEANPKIQVSGYFSPPMRDLGPDFELSTEILDELDAIRRANPDIIWVGISSPKQEHLMSRLAPLLGRGVFIGVGAAFDFHSGAVKRAPRWLRVMGLEWLHRLTCEPRRLWYRYLVLAPRFIVKVAAESLRTK